MRTTYVATAQKNLLKNNVKEFAFVAAVCTQHANYYESLEPTGHVGSLQLQNHSYYSFLRGSIFSLIVGEHTHYWPSFEWWPKHFQRHFSDLENFQNY